MRPGSISTLAMCTTATLLLAANNVSANLVVDGGFEEQVAANPFQTINANTQMGGWTVTAGSVDLIRNYWQAAEGNQSLDMAGLSSGTIKQTINGTQAGAWYFLTFDMSGNPDGPPDVKTLHVTFGNTSMDFTFNKSGITRTDMGWQLRSGYFQANGTSTDLIFSDISGAPGFYGSSIDNVSLTAVPEPATVLAATLLLLPFGASAIRVLRRRSLA